MNDWSIGILKHKHTTISIHILTIYALLLQTILDTKMNK